MREKVDYREDPPSKKKGRGMPMNNEEQQLSKEIKPKVPGSGAWSILTEV